MHLGAEKLDLRLLDFILRRLFSININAVVEKKYPFNGVVDGTGLAGFENGIKPVGV